MSNTNTNSRVTRTLTGLAVAFALSFGLGGTASAALLNYNFSLTGTNGPLSGSTGTGSFLFDDTSFSGIGTETFGPFDINSFFPDGVVSFDVSFGGIDFSISGDTGFDTPSISFFNGVLFDLSYSGFSGDYGMVVGTSGNDFQFLFYDTGLLIDGRAFGSTAGSVTTPSISVVPLPAALPLFLSGLTGFGFVGRKRRKRGAMAEGFGSA
ncbi:MAG TPA: VPLPA-CTERM sorting domain-containing protein [Rhodospirillales bacterium]|nr:VPLPA-CTERM sorting domain-containing protein [Rhodospirillales bacterium]